MANYYDILGVSRGASEKDIRAAFRRLARQHHPDVSDDPASGEKFKEINEAYTVLSDAESRRKYDRYGQDWKHAGQYEQAGRGGGFTFSTSGGSRGSVFDQFFGGLGAQEFRPAPAEYHVEVTLEEAFNGASRRLQMQDGRRLEVKIPPGVDNGSRVHISADPDYGGDFYLIVSVKDDPRFRRKGKDLFVDVDVPLDDAVLGGELTVPTIKGRLALTIPEGTQNGRRFRLAGQGMPVLNNPANNPRGGGAHRGDLFATVKVKLPSDYTPDELDLFKKLRAKRAKQPAFGKNGAGNDGAGEEQS